ncbi:hypothetical protein ACI78V_17745 [Geodermatophilus sp. SYSU D00742]
MTGTDTAREAPWDLSFLRVGTLVTAGLTAVAAPVAGLLGGWDDALAVLLGAAVVTAFFAVSGIVIAWAGRHGDAFTLPAALGSFLVKILVIAAVLQSVPADGWLDRRTLAWAVIAGALLWSVVQQRWVWTRRLYYVQPPAAPSTGGISSPPGGGATRG